MSALELKNDILKLVAETDDLNILNQVQAYFKSLKNNTNWWTEISKKEKNLITIGQQQLANGHGISHEQVRYKVNQLLNKN